MKRFSLLLLAIPLLSIVSIAQTPSPSVVTTPVPGSDQFAASVSPSPSPTTESKGPPNLPWVVEMFASAVMLVSVIGVLWLVMRHRSSKDLSIGPRHIQFVSVCLIVPTILILGLEKVLTSETSATLIGGLAGYLLSGLGRYEPPKSGQGGRPTTDQGTGSRGSGGKGGLAEDVYAENDDRNEKTSAATG